MLQKLHNPNIDFQDAFKRKGILILEFEFVEKNILELLEEHSKGLDPNLIKHLIYQLCKAINYLHEQKVVYSWYKTRKLISNWKYGNEIMWFWICPINFRKFQKIDYYVSTRWYLAPELLITQEEYNTEVDYWAIGYIMGELEDRNPLFPGENKINQIYCIQKVLAMNKLISFILTHYFKGRIY